MITRTFASLLIGLALAACGGSDNGTAAPAPVPGPTPGPSTDAPYSSLPPGSFALTLHNDTRGQWADDQIHIAIIGVNAPGGQVTYVRPTSRQVVGASVGGVLATVQTGSAQDNNAPDCIASGGTCYANYSFTLADLGAGATLFLPGDGKYYGSRIYVSVGKPLLQQVSPDGRGISQPNLESTADPNFTTVFDWFEFTYDPTAKDPVPFGGNVTQVDLYSIPLAFTVSGVNGTTMERGITLGAGSSAGVWTRDELFAKYQSSVGPAFKNLVHKDGERIVRLVAPYHADNFRPGGVDAGHFDAYVDQVWSQFATSPASLDFYDQGGTIGNRFYGCAPAAIRADQLCFMYRSADQTITSGPWYMAKPSSYDVLQNGGALQPGCSSNKDLNECNAFGAQLAAALNRAVAQQPARWHDASAFYLQNPKNDWAQFWHSVSIDGRAYGMGFDDTGDQSSVAILPLQENIQQLKIGIGW